MADNHLHRYSNVLKPVKGNIDQKRPVPRCKSQIWAPRQPLNATSTVIMHQKDAKFDDIESNANLLRKLEGEKGIFFFIKTNFSK